VNVSDTALYKRWKNMIYRCRNPNHSGYYYYGGSGVTVCAEWESFDVFLADMGEPLEGQSLERVDNKQGYSKDNCVWADRKTQARNMRSNINITILGTTQCLKAWCDEFGLVYGTVIQRIRLQGETPEKALSYPTGRKGGVPSYS
jgi:hypothetical protein